MIAALGLAGLAIASGGPAAVSVPPRAASWEEATREVFDPRWILPDELPYCPRASGPELDLARALAALAAARHPASERDPQAPRCLGDVVLAVREAGGGTAAADRVLARVAAAQPELARSLEPFARELFADDSLADARWRPDPGDRRDGIVFARPLTIEGLREKPWSRLGGSDRVLQAATLIDADLDAIKEAENDYTAYPRRPGSAYERIGPVEGSHLRGVDASGNPFAALRIVFESDLPWPFSTFTCDLRILTRVDERGAVVCDIYSRSGDFHWLAGRDRYTPVRASDGRWVATLLVRWYGFDLDGVPDGDDARAEALCASLGSLTRESEALFARSGRVARTVEGTVPPFEVRGTPQR